MMEVTRFDRSLDPARGSQGRRATSQAAVQQAQRAKDEIGSRSRKLCWRAGQMSNLLSCSPSFCLLTCRLLVADGNADPLNSPVFHAIAGYHIRRVLLLASIPWVQPRPNLLENVPRIVCREYVIT